MFVAYRDHGCIRVPGERTEYVTLDGKAIALRTSPPYVDLDGSVAPGWTLSPVRTDIFFTHFPEDGADFDSNRRVRPVVCARCHDSGEDGTGPAYWCDACHGYAERVNLHRCAECGDFSREPLPVHPRATLNHALLLPHAHVACAVEALRGSLVAVEVA